MNKGEANKVAEALWSEGHQFVSDPRDADALILFTCTVIETTEKRMVKMMKRLSTLGKPLVVAGCMPSVQPDLVRECVPDAIMVKPEEHWSIPRVLGKEELTRTSLSNEIPPRLRGPTKILPIAQGCLGWCTYCITRLARGELMSYPLDRLVEEAKKALLLGKREILLTAQDTAAYGRDNGTTLPQLIGRMCQLDGKFRLRVGMMNPSSVMPILDDLIESYHDEKVYNFLHLPVQSGSDEVLERMGRSYTVEDFLQIVEEFRSRIDPITISTDIIVGFPGETDEEFEQSLDLIEEVKPDIVNITRFSKREGTPAAGMERQVHGWVAKERSRRLTKLAESIGMERNSSYVGRTEKILTTERIKAGTTVGRTDAYKPVVLPAEMGLGIFCRTTVVGCTRAYLVGSGAEPS